MDDLEDRKRLVAERREAALAKKAIPENGHDRLEEAIAILIQNQAAFLRDLAEIERTTFRAIQPHRNRHDGDTASSFRA